MKKSLFARVVALLGICVGCGQPGSAQSKPLFPGEAVLDSCVVELPLTYAKKDKERYLQAAHYLDGQELIYLVYNKKEAKGLCTRVYVVVETSTDGSEVVYLETTDDHLRMDGLKQAFFPKFKAASERFYNAECFDRHLVAHPELKAHVVDTPVVPAH